MITRRHTALLALVTFLLPAVFLASPAHAADDIAVSGRLSDKTMPAARDTPSRLATDRRVLLDLSLANRTDRDLEVGTVVLRGRVVGLTFFDYETSVTIAVPAGATVARQFSLDLAGLKGQAIGLFNADVEVLDQNRRLLASRKTAVDVRGSWRSVYSLFGVLLTLATVAAFTRAILDLARQRLSPNRWRRAIRFFVPGLGFGLVVIFTLSAMRVFLPGPTGWIPILAVASAIGFAMGYFTPTPDTVAVRRPAMAGRNEPLP